MRIASRWLVAAATLVVASALLPAAASATPGKSSQWTTLVGSCDGVPAVVYDPPGPGPTAFSTLTGKMGVGRLFQGINVVTGEIAFQDEYGTALEHANQPIVMCDFPVPPDVSPDGTANWVFRVYGFFRS